MAKFFIDRPIFAIVIALLIMVAGALSIFSLPIEQYPPIAPPTVQISTTYPGASATTVQDTVVQVIEQQMSGLDNLLYMSSISDDTGQSTTTLTFATGTDPNIAQVQVQNKLKLATPNLPQQVQQSGIRVTKSTNSFLMVIGFVSADNSMNKFDIANYVVSNVQDPISRVNGVGNLSIFGSQYAMRIWLDPNKLNSFALAPLDVTAALQAQNVQISGGQLGGTPAVQNQQLNAAITESTLLRTPEQFGAILLKVMPDGSQVRLRDVARVGLGAESFNIDNKYNGQPASGIGIQLATGANALQTANAVRARIAQLQPYFPHGLQAVYPNDVTPFIKISIQEVVKTLLEGIALVFLVMFLFLQNIRATLIPSIAVPVVLLGTFGVMAALGFTINTLSMFGLVLAPALCATILKPSIRKHSEKGGFFGWFNRRFDGARDRYVGGVRGVVARSGRFLAIYAVVIAAVGWLFVHLPTSFLPNEDQGYLFVQVQTPPGATQERTGIALDDVSNYLLKQESKTVAATFIVNGNNFAGRGQNQGQIFVQLKDWSQRTSNDLSVQALTGRISKQFGSYKDATITPVNPPPIRGLGTSSGFDFQLEDRGGLGHDKLMQARNQLLAMAAKDPMLAQVRPNGQDDNPTFKINVDREKAAALGVALSDVDQTFSIAWGSRFVNNFLDSDNR